MRSEEKSYLIEQRSNGQIEVTVEFPGGGGVRLRGLFDSEAKALAWLRLRDTARMTQATNRIAPRRE